MQESSLKLLLVKIVHFSYVAVFLTGDFLCLRNAKPRDL